MINIDAGYKKLCDVGDKEALDFHLDLVSKSSVCIVGGKYTWDEKESKFKIAPGKVFTKWVAKNKAAAYIKERNAEGAVVWLSLNEKENGNDNIKGVTSIFTIWLDIDPIRPDKNEPASAQEKAAALQEAVKIKEWIEGEYGAVGFLANSGNGFHIFFPVTPYRLKDEETRIKINLKQHDFLTAISKKSGVIIDTTTDTRRVSQAIGTPNLKLPKHPLQTGWINPVGKVIKSDRSEIAEAREANSKLLQSIINTKLEQANTTATTTSFTNKSKHPALVALLENDSKLNDLYGGHWQAYKFKSRSEAEASVVSLLGLNGFTDSEIIEVMAGCGIGKWQAESKDYRQITLKKGRKYIQEHTQKSKAKESTTIPLIHKGEDFGAIRLEKKKGEVLVTILGKDGIIKSPSLKHPDFYLHSNICDTLLKHVKGKLTEQEYNSFVTHLQGEIENALKPKEREEDTPKAETKYDEETQAEALELLKAPDLLYKIKLFLELWGKYWEDGKWKKKKPIIGEDANKLHVVCSSLSSLYSEKINALLLGKSSVGKSRTVVIPSLLFPDRTEDLAGMTEASPKNIEDDLSGRIFVLKEIEGSANAEYYLKILFDSEAEDMKIRTSEKDPETNHYTSVLRETVGKPVGLTTTAVPKYGVEFRNRFSLLQLDESREQTRRIKDMDMKMRREIPKDITKEVEKIRCAFSLLKPMEVKIKFEVFYPSDEVDARRAYKRLLTLIEIIALLHQYQRDTFVGEDGETYLKATIADFYYAYSIAEASIGMDVQELTENAQKLFTCLVEDNEETKKENWYVSDMSSLIKEKLSLKWSQDTLRGYLKELRLSDFLSFCVDETKRGNPYLYSLGSNKLTDVIFCTLFAENPDQQKNFSVRAIEDGEGINGLFVFEDRVHRGGCVWDPFTGEKLFLTSENEIIQRYIHTYSYNSSANTNNQQNHEAIARVQKAAADLLKAKTLQKPQIKTTTLEIKRSSPIEKGICELCNKERYLTYECRDGGLKYLVCDVCGNEEIEMLQKKESEEVPK